MRASVNGYGVGSDDIADAFAALWTAAQFSGVALNHFPATGRRRQRNAHANVGLSRPPNERLKWTAEKHGGSSAGRWAEWSAEF